MQSRWSRRETIMVFTSDFNSVVNHNSTVGRLDVSMVVIWINDIFHGSHAWIIRIVHGIVIGCSTSPSTSAAFYFSVDVCSFDFSCFNFSVDCCLLLRTSKSKEKLKQQLDEEMDRMDRLDGLDRLDQLDPAVMHSVTNSAHKINWIPLSCTVTNSAHNLPMRLKRLNSVGSFSGQGRVAQDELASSWWTSFSASGLWDEGKSKIVKDYPKINSVSARVTWAWLCTELFEECVLLILCTTFRLL
eukprot:g12446.t1